MTQPSYHPDCNPVEQQARQDMLDDLYRRSGRDRKDHPMHSLYTGLWQEWTQETPTP
jgi:hypothetical protein